ncbi:MAG: HPr family phosphocarrier protein [Clostridiales bacterium]|jgi:phosphocarrier protein HPr|nr:HPr family phosphocarrier protein [Clostridia bacterium]NLH58782.1 HPr family phosphocarrier protein [Clostridiales bacterium]
MIEKEFVIDNEAGLHARPAARLIKAADAFDSEIRIIKGDKIGNAKSLLSVLALGIFKGNKITIQADGPDEVSALYRISRLIENNFVEED